MKTKVLLMTALILSVVTVSANKERPMSEEEMLQKASDVAVGEVIQVRSVKATTRQEIEFTEMEATFKFTSPTKGSSKMGELWILRYQIVDSPRYAGDKVPKFKKATSSPCMAEGRKRMMRGTL